MNTRPLYYRTLAENAEYFSKEGYCKPMAVYLGSVLLLARQAHPTKPIDIGAIDRFAPDWRLVQPQGFIQSSANKSTPLRDGYEWGYPF